jgi:hypothetical protein
MISIAFCQSTAAPPEAIEAVLAENSRARASFAIAYGAPLYLSTKPSADGYTPRTRNQYAKTFADMRDLPEIGDDEARQCLAGILKELRRCIPRFTFARPFAERGPHLQILDRFFDSLTAQQAGRLFSDRLEWAELTEAQRAPLMEMALYSTFQRNSPALDMVEAQLRHWEAVRIRRTAGTIAVIAPTTQGTLETSVLYPYPLDAEGSDRAPSDTITPDERARYRAWFHSAPQTLETLAARLRPARVTLDPAIAKRHVISAIDPAADPQAVVRAAARLLDLSVSSSDPLHLLPRRVPHLSGVGDIAPWLEQALPRPVLDYLGVHAPGGRRRIPRGTLVEIGKRLALALERVLPAGKDGTVARSDVPTDGQNALALLPLLVLAEAQWFPREMPERVLHPERTHYQARFSRDSQGRRRMDFVIAAPGSTPDTWDNAGSLGQILVPDDFLHDKRLERVL